jgi:hypothetical protein
MTEGKSPCRRASPIEDKVLTDRAAALDFLQSHVNDMRKIAAAHRMKLPTYFLEMAYVELSDMIREDRPFDRRNVVMFADTVTAR